MRRSIASAFAVLLLLPLLIPFVACEEDTASSEVELVTVAGTVRNVDDRSNAAGVRVRQFGTQYKDDVPTGTDGRFELQVPRGITLQLLTDDFSSQDDAWIPMINVDVVPIVANDDILDLPIHACSNQPPGDTGSMAMWERYLKSCDDTENGDLFQPKSVKSAGGTVSIVFIRACDFAPRTFDSLTCALNIPEAPIGYMNNAVLFNASGPYSTTCNIFEPASATQSTIGWVLSVFDSTYNGTSANLSVVDNRSSGFIVPNVKVPVAKGTVSLVLVGVVNGHGVSFPTFAEHCSLFP